MASERRRYPRINVNWPAFLLNSQKTIVGETLNFSLGGAFISSPVGFEQEQPFRILIKTPYHVLSLLMLAEMPRINLLSRADDFSRYGFGVRFKSFFSNNRQFLSKIMKGSAMADKVLVVDDEFTARDILTDFLTGEGYEVILASNGEEALAKATAEDPQVILLDIGIPVIDGIEVCKRLKADGEMRFIPVIMMTGFSYRKREAVEAGADDFIRKPFDLVELSSRLKYLLRMKY